MPLDRQSIEKKDFPIGRRGYDPDAVDAHLGRIAEDVEALQAQPAPQSTLATAAGDRIQSIVDAAERTAAEIQQQAEDDARTAREDAAADAARTREGATAESRAHVARVMEGTAAMQKRIEAMEAELGSLLDALKTGTNRLTADLELLQGSMDDLQGPGERTPAPASAPVPAAAAATQAFEADEDDDLDDTPAAGSAAEGPSPDEIEGARLVALNMALNGTPREETEQYLEENFSLPDADGLLDEVYATVGD